MTLSLIEDQSPYVRYVAGASQTQYDFPWPITAPTDVKVQVGIIDQVYATDYAVAGVLDPDGGYIILGTAPATGAIVTLYRNMAVARDVEFAPGGDFRHEDLNTALARLTLLESDRRLREQREFRVAWEKDIAGYDFFLRPEANKHLAWNAAANAIVGVPAGPSVSLPFPEGFNDPRTFGAVAGEVDMPQAIINSQAFKDCADTPGVMIIPPLLFYLGWAPIIFDTDNATILCFGHIKLMVGCTSPPGDGWPVPVSVVHIRDTSGVLWWGGEIDGNNQEGANGISVSSVESRAGVGDPKEDNRIENVVIRNCKHWINVNDGTGVPHEFGLGEGGGKGFTLQFGSARAQVSNVTCVNCSIGYSVEGRFSEAGEARQICLSDIAIEDCVIGAHYLGVYGPSAVDPTPGGEDLGGDEFAVLANNMDFRACATDQPWFGVIEGLRACNIRMTNTRITNKVGEIILFRGQFRDCYFEGQSDVNQQLAFHDGSRNEDGGNMFTPQESPSQHSTWKWKARNRGNETPGDQTTGPWLTDAGASYPTRMCRYEIDYLIGDGDNDFTDHGDEMTQGWFGGAHPDRSNLYRFHDIGSTLVAESRIDMSKFGAVPDVDCTVALQAAIDLLAGTAGTAVNQYGVGGVIYFPAGTWLVNGPINLVHTGTPGFNHGITIEGDGPMTTTIKNTDVAGGSLFKVVGEADNSINGFCMRNLSLLGTKDSGIGVECIKTIRQVLFDRVDFHNHGSIALSFDDTCNMIVIDACRFRNDSSVDWWTKDTTAIKLGTNSEQVWLYGNSIRGYKKGLHIGDYANGVSLYGGDIADNGTGVLFFGSDAADGFVTGGEIRGVYFESNGKDVDIGNAGSTYRAFGIAIKGNSISKTTGWNEAYSRVEAGVATRRSGGVPLPTVAQANKVCIDLGRAEYCEIDDNEIRKVDANSVIDYVIYMATASRYNRIGMNPRQSTVTQTQIFDAGTSNYGHISNSDYLKEIFPTAIQVQGECSVKGNMISKLAAAAPSDGVLAASEVVWWLDESTNKIKLKLKYADGTTVKVAELALT